VKQVVEVTQTPIIPVTLHFDETRQRGRKQPRVEWDRATTDEAAIAEWWRVWPDALPGIPLRMTNLCVVDADSAEGVAEVTALRMLGPHSKVATANGGLHMVFAQPAEPIGKFVWSPGIEVLGTSALLTCYDLEALRFPYVAPRAVLPEMFWKPKAECGWKVEDGFMVEGRKSGSVSEAPTRYPRIKRREERDATHLADLTAALWEMDPVDWRGDYDGWFGLLVACQAAGISKREWLKWCASDPVYAADGGAVERMWDAAKPRHAGALYKALSERGIRIGNERSLYSEVPRRPTPTRNLQDRTRYHIAYFNRSPSEQRLFDVACSFAEMVAEGRLKIGMAQKLLWNNLTRFRKSIGDDEFQRTIANAFRHVEEKMLSEE
jgi:hypothetical protein